MMFKGMWDLMGNSPPLKDGVGTEGDQFTVYISGLQSFMHVNFGSGEMIIENGKTIVYHEGKWGYEKPKADD